MDHSLLARLMNQYRPDRVSVPGETLLEFLKAEDMSQTELAGMLYRSKTHINEIVKGKKAITAQIALELEHALGVPAEFWMARETAYRLALLRKKERGRK